MRAGPCGAPLLFRHTARGIVVIECARRQRGADLDVRSLMVSTATIILAGIPAAIYERWIGAKEDSTEALLWIWLAATGLLTLPAMGNFLEIGL
jgi:hypothetical protein